jgi:hypothetical protein
MTVQSALDRSIKETPSLIGSDKIQGTAVYRSNGDKVGAIPRAHHHYSIRTFLVKS